MNRVIGIVCEGPTDYEVLSRIVDLVTGDDNEYRRLQPEESLAGEFGNGWKGVWKWCESYGPFLYNYMTKATPQLDCIIVHMDGDVSRKEKEVHCVCSIGSCGQAGHVHPLTCTICKSGKCPVALPCASHETTGDALHLHDLIVSWLCKSENKLPIIITVPCDSIDTWVAVSYGDITENCERYPDPWRSIITRSASYHSIRVRGHKKHVQVYQVLSDNICENWDTVKKFCMQAQVFESAIHEKLLS